MGDFAQGFFYKRFDMNTKMSKLALAIGALVMAGGAMAVDTQEATASATATVITPLTIANNTALIFGSIAQNKGLAGTVVVTPASGRSTTGGALLPAVGTAGAAATFTVTGEGTSAYTITLPTTDLVLNGTVASTTMMMNTFTVAEGAVGTVLGTTGTLDGGTGNLNVGATLVMTAAQSSGTYTGSFPVTVAYN